MIHAYPDGTTIEIGHGDTYPPGHIGQHANANRPWVRANGGPWMPAGGARSTWAVRQRVEAAETASEAMGVIVDEDTRRAQETIR